MLKEFADSSQVTTVLRIQYVQLIRHHSERSWKWHWWPRLEVMNHDSWWFIKCFAWLMSSMEWTGWRDCQIHDPGEKYEDDATRLLSDLLSLHISCHDTTRKVVVTLSNPHRGPQERVCWGQSLPIYVVAEHPAGWWQAPDKKSVSRSINVNQDKMDWMYEHSHTAWGSESVSMCSWALSHSQLRLLE